MRIYLFIFLLTSTFCAYSQNVEKRQTLENKLWNITQDSVAKILGNLSAIYAEQNEKVALEDWNVLLAKAKKKDKLDITMAVYKTMISYLRKQNPIEALKVLNDQIKYCEKKGLKKELLEAYKQLGQFYSDSYKAKDKAIVIYTKMLELAQNLKDSSYIFNAYVLTGGLYYDEDYKKSRYYLLKAIELKKYMSDTRTFISSLNSIGLIYRNEQNYPEALKYFEAAYKDAVIYQDTAWQGIVTGNMGLVFLAQKNYPAALKCSLKDVELSRGKDQDNVVRTYGGISDIYLRMNQLKLAKSYADSARIAAKDIKYLPTLVSMLRALKNYYETTQDFKNALICTNQLNIYRDSINKEKQIVLIREAEAKYNFAKQQELISSLEEKALLENQNAQQQKLISYGSGIVLIIVLIFGYLQYKGNQKSKKMNQTLQTYQSEILLQNEELLQNHEELTAQKELLTTGNENLELFRSKITASIQSAYTIQQAILPSKSKLDEILVDYFILNRPKDHVSGDFYWVNQVDAKKIFIIADCTGHGVSGAFITIIGKMILDKVIIAHGIYDPTEILNNMHTMIQATLRQQETQNLDGMDVAVCVFEHLIDGTDQTKVEFAGAKRPFYYVDSQKREPDKLLGSRKAIGGRINQAKHYQTFKILLPPKSMIYMASDGYADQNNQHRKSFGEKRFANMFSVVGHLPIVEQQRILEKVLDEYMQGVEQRDDILLAGFRI